MKQYQEMEIDVVVIEEDIVRTSDGNGGGVELPEVPISAIFGNSTFGEN